jgi:hypothetical protein
VDISPLAIAILQIVALVFQAVLYARGKNAVDLEKRDRGTFGGLVDNAVRIAEDAMRTADRIDVEKYRALASLVEQQATTIATLRAQVVALEESVASLSNKLASRERADRSAERRAAATVAPLPEALPVQEAVQPGGMDAATLARYGAIPLHANNHAAPEAPERPRSFGRVASR